MRTLKSLFSRYGSPSSEMNETKHFYFTRADHIESIEHVQSEDKKAVNTINELLELAELLKEYRKTLFERAQEFLTAGYAMQLKITRDILQ